MSRVNVLFTGDASKLSAAVGRATARIDKFKASTGRMIAGLAGVGLSVGVLVMKFNELRQEYDRIGKLATRFDISAESVQHLELAAKLTGSSLEKFQGALTKATVAGVEAGQGLETYRRAFEALGIDVERFNKMAPDKKLMELSRAFRETKDESVAFTAAYRILGRAGAEMIPFFREAGAALEQAGQASVVSDEQIRSIEKMNDRMAVLSQTLRADLMKAFLNIEPVVTGMTKKMMDFTGSLGAVVAAATGGDIGGLENDGTTGGAAMMHWRMLDAESNRVRASANGNPKEASYYQSQVETLARRFSALPLSLQRKGEMASDLRIMEQGGASLDEKSAMVEKYNREIAMIEKAEAAEKKKATAARAAAEALKGEGDLSTASIDKQVRELQLLITKKRAAAEEGKRLASEKRGAASADYAEKIKILSAEISGDREKLELLREQARARELEAKYRAEGLAEPEARARRMAAAERSAAEKGGQGAGKGFSVIAQSSARWGGGGRAFTIDNAALGEARARRALQERIARATEKMAGSGQSSSTAKFS